MATDIDRLKEQQASLQHVSEHLANERTILAWIRTAIAVITLGVGVNRFSLFLVEFSHIVPGGRPPTKHAEQLGIGLVVLGIFIMLGAIWHYLDIAKAIDEGTYRPSRLKIVLAALTVVVIGGASLVWMEW